MLIIGFLSKLITQMWDVRYYLRLQLAETTASSEMIIIGTFQKGHAALLLEKWNSGSYFSSGVTVGFFPVSFQFNVFRVRQFL